MPQSKEILDEMRKKFIEIYISLKRVRKTFIKLFDSNYSECHYLQKGEWLEENAEREYLVITSP